MERGKTSVIVPVYNVEDYLERCIDSLIVQTLPFGEIILVDDGSTDSSGQICDRYAQEQPTIRVLHCENGGLSTARNRGIQVANGEFLTFVDSDDWVHPLYNEVLCKAISETDADVAICQHVREDDHFVFPSLSADSMILRRFSTNDYLRLFFRVSSNRCVHYAWGKLYRQTVVEKEHFPAGMYNEDVEGFFKVLLNAHSLVEVLSPAPLYCYYVNARGITGRGFGENYLSLHSVWCRIRELALRRRPDLVSYVDYNLRRTDFTVLCDMLIHGDKESDQTYEQDRVKLQKSLRCNLSELLRDPMTISRKIGVVVLACAYPVVRLIWRKAQ